MYPKGQYIMDGRDLYTVFGVTISSGSEDLLKFPKRKESISHNWSDQNGLDIDLTRPYFEARAVTLQCNIMASNEAEWWMRYNGFLSLLMQPDLRRLEVAELNSSFFLYYTECSSFTRFTRIKETEEIASKFTITLMEKEPMVVNQNVFIVTEEPQFIIS